MPIAGDLLFHGRFRLRAPIGRGGAGVVWEADDLRDGAVVAIKLLPADPGGLAAAEREAEVAVRVRHASMVRVFLTFEEGAHVGVVMERCLGSTAEEVLVRGPLTPERAASVVAAVLDVLEAAHAAAVVHRDVKPANVLLRADGSVALADWGIARALFGSGGTHTTSVALLGTLPYLAPELRHDPRAASPASDLYAAGMTLAWLCTGALPADPYVPEGDAALRAALPPALADVVRRACAYAPDARFPRARDMAEALRAADLSRGSTAPPGGALRGGVAPPPQERQTPARNAAGRAGWVAAAALATVTVAAYGLLLRSDPTSDPDVEGGAPLERAPRATDLARCPDAPDSFVEQRARAPVETIGATVAHLDADGRLDVVFSNQGAESITIWWSRPDGLPQERSELAVPRVSGAAAGMDVDADGVVDLLVPHKDEGAFSVLRNLGGRTFAAGTRILQGPAPTNLLALGGNAVLLGTETAVYVRRHDGGKWPPAIALGPAFIGNARAVGFVEDRTAWFMTDRPEGGHELRVASDDVSRVERRALPDIEGRMAFAPWFGADGIPVGIVGVAEDTLVRVVPGEPCRLGTWIGSTVQALADLDADGAIDVIGSSTCSGCTSNQVLGRGVR